MRRWSMVFLLLLGAAFPSSAKPIPFGADTFEGPPGDASLDELIRCLRRLNASHGETWYALLSAALNPQQDPFDILARLRDASGPWGLVSLWLTRTYPAFQSDLLRELTNTPYLRAPEDAAHRRRRLTDAIALLAQKEAEQRNRWQRQHDALFVPPADPQRPEHVSEGIARLLASPMLEPCSMRTKTYGLSDVEEQWAELSSSTQRSLPRVGPPQGPAKLTGWRATDFIEGSRASLHGLSPSSRLLLSPKEVRLTRAREGDHHAFQRNIVAVNHSGTEVLITQRHRCGRNGYLLTKRPGGWQYTQLARSMF